ncbi:MAG: NAD-dependent epimerase/dehydratase family protein, partial [Cyanobacteria bacterium K_DeepCast_0m_m1_088]|nr:NAD-dependent epimerase/dehydratase family protein [Cyanobacteria bacterium K_DeepCast_0m_m1_088]MBM5793999.1 NAD-dependent epimerase/dehydratase family protein [Cyanobacteria bacterium K_DeepCast_0m_m1_088]
MRLLLLGCSGFVGRELVPFLLELGHEVTLVSRQPQPFPALVGKRLSCLHLNPADPASWAHNGLDVAMSQAEGVVNLAG